MSDRLIEALRKAAEARAHAARCVDEDIRAEWLKVAIMWDEIASDFRAFDEMEIRTRKQF